MGEVSDYGAGRTGLQANGELVEDVDPDAVPARPENRETATDPAAENRSTPENPVVDLPNSADIPTPPADDQADEQDPTATPTSDTE